MPELRWNTNSVTRSAHLTFVDFVRCHDFTQHVKTPTRGKNILDLIFTNSDELVRELTILPPVGNSDHSSVSFKIFMSTEKSPIVFKRLFSKGDYTLICEYLASVMWIESFERAPTVDSKFEMFLDILYHAIELFIPWGKVVATRATLPDYLQRMLDHRSCLFNTAYRSNLSSDWEAFKKFSEIFAKKLNKYNSYIEKKVVESGRAKTKFLSLIEQ